MISGISMSLVRHHRDLAWDLASIGEQRDKQTPMLENRQIIQHNRLVNDYDCIHYNSSWIFHFQAPLIPSGLLGAALGVTRAVTQFLGVALAGAGQAFQTAFTAGSAGPSAAGGGGNNNNYYGFSGRWFAVNYRLISGAQLSLMNASCSDCASECDRINYLF